MNEWKNHPLGRDRLTLLEERGDRLSVRTSAACFGPRVDTNGSGCRSAATVGLGLPVVALVIRLRGVPHAGR